MGWHKYKFKIGALISNKKSKTVHIIIETNGETLLLECNRNIL